MVQTIFVCCYSFLKSYHYSWLYIYYTYNIYADNNSKKCCAVAATGTEPPATACNK